MITGPKSPTPKSQYRVGVEARIQIQVAGAPRVHEEVSSCYSGIAGIKAFLHNVAESTFRLAN